MKVLVVGGGGREHAIIRKLKEAQAAPRLYCAPGNGGIAADAECVPIKATDVAGHGGMGRAERHGLCGGGAGRPPGPGHGGRAGGKGHSLPLAPIRPPPSSRPARCSPRI